MKTTTLLLSLAGTATAYLRHQVGSDAPETAAEAKRAVTAVATPTPSATPPSYATTLARCNADNCARAVTGTALGPAAVSSHKADCSSFFSYTVIPEASTTYVTVTPAPISEPTTVTISETYTSEQTITVTDSTTNIESFPATAASKRAADAAAAAAATTISPSAVPPYASPCSGTARYSSVCACFGISKTTSTASTPTSTVTVTALAATVFIPTTVVDTAVVTATVTEGATYTDVIPCGQTINGPDGYAIVVACQVVPDPQPDETVDTIAGVDWDGCVEAADGSFSTTSFTFDLATLTCVLYHDFQKLSGEAPAPEGVRIVYAYFPQS